jgi:topoisomerase IA-like protein
MKPWEVLGTITADGITLRAALDLLRLPRPSSSPN